MWVFVSSTFFCAVSFVTCTTRLASSFRAGGGGRAYYTLDDERAAVSESRFEPHVASEDVGVPQKSEPSCVNRLTHSERSQMSCCRVGEESRRLPSRVLRSSRFRDSLSCLKKSVSLLLVKYPIALWPCLGLTEQSTSHSYYLP